MTSRADLIVDGESSPRPPRTARLLMSWLVPGAPVLLLAALVLAIMSEQLILDLTGQYRWVVYALGIALAGGFHRSRLFVVLISLGAIDIATLGVPETDILSVLGTVLLFLIGVLALVRDRGVASSAGLGQIVISTVLAAVPALIFYDSVNVEAFLNMELLPGWMTGWTGLPQSVALFALVSVGGTAYGVYRWRGAVERSLLWCQLGILLVVHPTTGWAADELFLMSTGLIIVLTVLQTSYAMAYRDDLTGLPARRALGRDLESLGGTYTVAMVDVDRFKQFNDSHGHDVGDQVLKLVSVHLAGVGGGGKAYRYGGEEFTLLFPGKVRDEALVHLNSVRVAVEGATFSLRRWHRPKEKPSMGRKAASVTSSKKLSVTVSIGVSDSTDSDLSAEQVLKKSDRALYRAKNKGRNQVST